MGNLGLLVQVGPFDRDTVWLAARGPYLATRMHAHPAVGPLLAAAIDAGPTGSEVLQTLIEVGNGEHPIGVMGRHVVTALLNHNWQPLNLRIRLATSYTSTSWVEPTECRREG